MKKWLKWIPFGAAVLIFSALGAQPAPLNREKIRNTLQLRPEQEPRFFAVMEKSAAALKTLRDNTGLTPEQRRAEARKIAAAHRAEISGILSKEQMDKWTALRQERMRNRGPRPPFPAQGRGPGAQRGRPGPNPELLNAVKAYSEKEILTVLKKERAILEKQISPKDQETLASLRTQVKAMGRPGGMYRPGPAQVGAKARPNPELARLAEKYRSEINRIFARLEPQVDRWNKDLQAIHEKYAPPQKGRGNGTVHGPGVPSATRLIHPQRFLLLDSRA